MASTSSPCYANVASPLLLADFAVVPRYRCLNTFPRWLLHLTTHARPHSLLFLAAGAFSAGVFRRAVHHFPNARAEVLANFQLVASSASFPLAVGAHSTSFFQLPLRLMVLALRLRLLALCAPHRRAVLASANTVCFLPFFGLKFGSVSSQTTIAAPPLAGAFQANALLQSLTPSRA